MSNNPDDDSPTCSVCGGYLTYDWHASRMVCDACEDEREAREAEIMTDNFDLCREPEA